MAEQLASGNSVTLQLDANDYVSITGSASVMVVGATASASATNSGTATYGPYSGGASMRIVASGAVSYTVTQPSFSPVVQVDSTTGALDTASAAALAASGIYPVARYTWATRPTPSASNIGMEITITDVGPQYNRFVSDGTYWRPVGMVPLLFQATEITKTDADTAAQTVFSYTVKSGLLAPGCSLYCEGQMSANAVVAVNKNLNFTLGGVSAGGYLVGTTLKDARFDLRVKALTDGTFDSWSPGSANSYAASGGTGYVSGSRPLSSSDLTFSATMNWATAGSGSNTLTFRPFKLWLVP